MLSLGIVGTSAKENERRVPIHPRHLARIDADLRAAMIVERGYGANFGVDDEQVAALVGRVGTRAEVMAADVVLLPKPVLADVEALRPGQVLWGWPHLVQDAALTQASIDRALTIIAWESMHNWSADGAFGVHTFHLNNEIAGYASVLHALSLIGVTGHYGPRRRAAVIGFGNTARGAVHALQALGIHDITVLTMRAPSVVASPIPGVRLVHLLRSETLPGRTVVEAADVVAGHGAPALGAPEGVVSTASALAGYDVIVNCAFQDTDRPLMFLDTEELDALRPGSLVVDVSCDAGMGFGCARPTTFEEPMFPIGRGAHYYGVDHSPSFLFDSATWTISEALVPHLRTVLSGPASWDTSDTIRTAIEIRDGVVQNPKILTFQRRHEEHPHPIHVEHG